MTKQRLRISPVMKQSAENQAAPYSAETILEAIINEIRDAGIPFAKMTVISPTSTSLRLRCQMPEGHTGITKTMVAVHIDGSSVNVRRDIDIGLDTAFAFDPVNIRELSLKDAAKAVVYEIRKLNDLLPQTEAKPAAEQPVARM